MIYIFGILHSEDLKTRIIMKVYIMDKYYFLFSILLNHLILSSLIKMDAFKSIPKYVLLSLNTIRRNGTLLGLLEPCFKLLSAYLIKELLVMGIWIVVVIFGSILPRHLNSMYVKNVVK